MTTHAPCSATVVHTREMGIRAILVALALCGCDRPEDAPTPEPSPIGQSAEPADRPPSEPPTKSRRKYPKRNWGGVFASYARKQWPGCTFRDVDLTDAPAFVFATVTAKRPDALGSRRTRFRLDDEQNLNWWMCPDADCPVRCGRGD